MLRNPPNNKKALSQQFLHNRHRSAIKLFRCKKIFKESSCPPYSITTFCTKARLLQSWLTNWRMRSISFIQSSNTSQNRIRPSLIKRRIGISTKCCQSNSRLSKRMTKSLMSSTCGRVMTTRTQTTLLKKRKKKLCNLI